MKTQASARKRMPLIGIALLALSAGCTKAPSTTFEEVGEFGSNPGVLRMFKYVPGSLKPKPSTGDAERPIGENEATGSPTSLRSGAPLVVVLHGCMQNAAEYGENSGWVQLADRFGVFLLLPEQQRGNNLTKCFNWYSPEDHGRDVGEALSIRQMIDRMQRDHAVDPQRIYVTGVSAGAAMTLALAAVYPEVFAGAAPLAGIAFGCADGLVSGLGCMRNPPDKEATDWAATVRSATSHQGPWPRISVWQGDTDAAVDPSNATAIIRQWTSLQGIDTDPELTDDLRGHIHSLYRGANGQVLIESYLIKGMAHGVPVDPGPGESQCGEIGDYFLDVDICSGLFIARFWGLDREVLRQTKETGQDQNRVAPEALEPPYRS